MVKFKEVSGISEIISLVNVGANLDEFYWVNPHDIKKSIRRDAHGFIQNYIPMNALTDASVKDIAEKDMQFFRLIDDGSKIVKED